MISYKLYLIRHGLTDGNAEGRYIGSTDLPLSEAGREALMTLAETHEYPQVQMVFSSPLKRCTETADILFPDRMVRVVDDLREYDFGAFEGKSASELEHDPDFLRWCESGMREAPAGAERMPDFIARCEAGFEHVIEQMMKERITEAALILHSGVMMNLLSRYGYPKREPIRWTAESGHGFTALLTAALWQRDKLFEVFDPIPYSLEETKEAPSYRFFDLESDD